MVYADMDKARLNNRRKLKRKLHTKEHKARDILRHAVFRGAIIKPCFCSICHNFDIRIEGHHADYGKPYEVIWACPHCHRIIHSDLFKRTGGLRKVGRW